MRKPNLLLVCVLFLTGCAVAQCKPGLDHRTLNRVKIQNTQVQDVNSWKQQWRMDAKQTAQHEVAEHLSSTPNRNPDMIPVTQVKGDDRTQVYSYTEPGRKVEITMKKPEWLLPYSGIYKIMMWVVTDVRTTCTK